ncbi:MAG: hypothetical protein DRH34_13915 [Deltaproteobacteria bacterium]|nr:MAG: hypothetical protein DRH34_13915 [Deltaproteobacteria bacterium]
MATLIYYKIKYVKVYFKILYYFSGYIYLIKNHTNLLILYDIKTILLHFLLEHPLKTKKPFTPVKA